MRKGRDKKKMVIKGENNNVYFIVATNVVASRLPERRPTETPTACANLKSYDE